MRLIAAFFVIFFSFAAGSDRAAADWQSSSRVQCATTCAQFGGAVTSDYFADTRTRYHVCRTNVNSEGGRAGYNLEKYGPGSKKCVVGYGGKEFATYEYSCLCNR